MVIIPIFSYLFVRLKDPTITIPPLRVDYDTFPDNIELISQFIFYFLTDDLVAYLTHRFFHMDFIYPYVHKVHHEYKNSVSFAGEYSHPIEFAFGNLIAANSGMLILGRRSHVFTSCLWIIFKVYITAEVHSGYKFPICPSAIIPLIFPPEFHNYHHLSFAGNYGGTTLIWDNVFQTENPKYKKYLKTRKFE